MGAATPAVLLPLVVSGDALISVAEVVDDASGVEGAVAEDVVRREGRAGAHTDFVNDEAKCDRAFFREERFFADLTWVMPGAHGRNSEHLAKLENVSRDCEAGEMGGMSGHVFLLAVRMDLILSRFLSGGSGEHHLIAEELEGFLWAFRDLTAIWGQEMGLVFVCVPDVCTPEQVLWRHLWEHVFEAPGTFELYMPPLMSGDMQVSRWQAASFASSLNTLESKAHCRTFENFNALKLFSIEPHEDPAFLASVPTLRECMELIENSSNSAGLRIYAWAHLGSTDPLCIGGDVSALKDLSVGKRFNQVSARRSDWVPERGAVTIVCAGLDERSLHALSNAKHPCQDLYAEWECCRNASLCDGKEGEITIEGLREDIHAIETRLIQLRKPRMWQFYWELGRLYDLLAQALSAGETSMRAASQAARWMELAIQLQDGWGPLHIQYGNHQNSYIHRLYGNDAVYQLLSKPYTEGTVDLRASRDSVKVLLTVFGEYGVHCRSTLLSILTHSSVTVAIFIAGDTAGVEDAREVLTDFKPGPRRVLAHLEFFDLSTNAAFRAAWRQLPAELQQKGDFRPVSGLARLFTDEYLPDWVDNLIYMDIGDVLVLGDILELWVHLDQFGPNQFIGLAGMPFQLTEYLALQQLQNVTMVCDKRGFNNGVLLLNLDRARAANFRSSLISTMWSLAESIPAQKFAKMRVMDMMNLHIAQQPEIFFELPCAWNYMPKAMKTEGDWGAQVNWSPRVWPLMVAHPGLLSASSMEHHCPGVAWSFAASAQHSDEAELLRFIPDSRSALRGCICGERVKLLHMAGRIKNQPWASLLLEEWGVPLDQKTFSTAAWVAERGPGDVA